MYESSKSCVNICCLFSFSFNFPFQGEDNLFKKATLQDNLVILFSTQVLAHLFLTPMYDFIHPSKTMGDLWSLDIDSFPIVFHQLGFEYDGLLGKSAAT